MELKDLIGKHYLTGVDFETEKIKQYDWSEDLEDAQCVRFCLDDKTYLAIEDPSDGYRSSMREIKVIPELPKNKFVPIEVYCIMMPNDYHNNEVLQCYDTISNEIVLEIGTKNTDDYYPSFTANWNPEKLYINKTPNP